MTTCIHIPHANVKTRFISDRINVGYLSRDWVLDRNLHAAVTKRIADMMLKAKEKKQNVAIWVDVLTTNCDPR